MRGLDDGSIDACITDPPYNAGKKFANDNMSREEFLEFTRKWVSLLDKKLEPTASFYCFINEKYLAEFKMLLDERFIFRRLLVWFFEQSYTHYPKNYVNRTEYILYYTKSNAYTFNDVLREKPSKSTIKRWEKHVNENGNIPYDRLMPSLQRRYKRYNYEKNPINIYRGARHSNLFTYHRPRHVERSSFNHETQKPEGLVTDLLLVSTNIGDVVIDPFAGSGTVPACAKKNDRKYIGIEIDAKAFAGMQARLQCIQKNKKIF